MENEETASIKKWHKIFWWLGIISLINIITREAFHLPEGIASIILGYPLGLVFGAGFAGLIMTITGMIGDFAIVWLIVAFVINTKIKKLARPVK